MKAIRSKVLVVVGQETLRTKICTWLSQAGYAIYEGRDVYKTLRLARQILPDLIVLDTSIKGVNIKQLIEIVEKDGLSKVVLLTDTTNDEFHQLLKLTALQHYSKIPLDRSLVLQMLESAIEVIGRHKVENAKNERKNKSVPQAAIIEEAKALLMRKWHLDEDKAYAFMRKKSMDHGVRIEIIARSIIKKYQTKEH